MSGKPTRTVPKQCLTITPEFLELLHGYTRYFITAQRSQIREYVPDGSANDQEYITDVDRQIRQAEAIATELEQLKGEVQRIYSWHFEKCADVFRQTLTYLGFERLQQVYALVVAVAYMCQMLKSENPMFSRSKFVEFINERR